MTGALTIPLTVFAFFVDTVWQRILFAAFALFCALLASYRVWLYAHRQVERLEDEIAAHAHVARRPKVAIERGASDGRPVTFDWKRRPASLSLMGMTPLFEFVNVGEESAFNVQASIAIEPTDFRIECVASVVAAGKRVAPEVKLFKGVEQWRDAPAFDIEKFAHAALTRLIAMRAEDEERRMTDEPGVHKWDLDIARDSLFSHLDLPPKTGLSVDFNVTYVDFERKWLFRTPHLMTFTPTLQPKSGEFRITLSAKPEPPPTPVPESAPAVVS